MNERDVFTAALHRPPEERSAFLDEACHGEVRLRQQFFCLPRPLGRLYSLLFLGCGTVSGGEGPSGQFVGAEASGLPPGSPCRSQARLAASLRPVRSGNTRRGNAPSERPLPAPGAGSATLALRVRLTG